MNSAATHIETLLGFGYSSEEIAFLDMVTAHSGYFVPNQFLEFMGQKKGRALREFRERLSAHQHATFHTYRNGERVHHVFARKLYQAFGRDNVRTRRRHALEYIRTRLVTLDFVLANQSFQFLEGEVQKVSFLKERFGIKTEDLPFRTYSNPRNSKSTVRYFVDRFPMFWSRSGKSDECLVTFTFIDSGQPTIQPFVTHLSSYRPLFSRLKAFEFIYVAPSSRQFGQAQTVFQQSVLGRDEGHRGSDILRYFRIRQDWEANERVPGADVVYLKNSRRRFVGNETETLYKQWASGEVRNDQLTAVWRSKFSLPTVEFRTAIYGRSLSVFSGNAPEELDPESESARNGSSTIRSAIRSGS
jgi:hypothetical protein